MGRTLKVNGIEKGGGQEAGHSKADWSPGAWGPPSRSQGRAWGRKVGTW